ncbi:EcsC family protein [Salinibacterium sp. NYA9b]
MADGMTSYEQRAWSKLIADERSRRKSLRTRATNKVSNAVSTAATKAAEAAQKLPGGEKLTGGIDASIQYALTGAAKAIFMPAIASVSIERRSNRLRKRHPEIGDTSPFFFLDLMALDKGRPRQIIPLTGALGSAGASIAITGAEVSATVSGGATAGVIVVAIAGDVGVSLALLGRAIAEVAVHYGFDPNEPSEEAFLMGVLTYSTATSLEGKATALTALARLSQQMMRKATWKELEKDVLVKFIQTVFTKIGVKLTHKRLAQIVPVLGGVISAGLSYDMLSRALGDATRIYRVRYLSEKYGLSFDDWLDQTMAHDMTEFGETSDLDEEPIDVVAEVQAAILGSERDEISATPEAAN